MSLALAELALEAAEKATRATFFRPALEILSGAQRMFRRGVAGMRATPELMARIDNFTRRSCELRKLLMDAEGAFGRDEGTES